MSRSRSRRWWLFRLAAALVVVATFLLLHRWSQQYLTLDELARREAAWRAYLDRHPVRSVLLGILVYTLASLIPGTGGKSIVAGWLLGFWRALLIVNLSLTIAATISLGVARYLLRDPILRRFHRFVTTMDRALERDGGFYVLALRALHAPYTLVNYTLGTTSIRPTTFWWATQIGLLPGNIVFVFAGTRVPTMHDLSRREFTQLLTPDLIGALVALTFLPFAMRWLARRIWPQAEQDAESTMEEIASA